MQNQKKPKLEKIFGVPEWLGIPRDTFWAKVDSLDGKCVKCDKPAWKYGQTLCHGCHSAFHKWNKKQIALENQRKYNEEDRERRAKASMEEMKFVGQ